MTKENIFKITVPIGEWRVALNVPRENESLYREAGALLNKQILELSNKYPKKTREEIYLYTAYQLAIHATKRENEKNNFDKLEQELDELLS